jgi:hypothetical protein
MHTQKDGIVSALLLLLLLILFLPSALALRALRSSAPCHWFSERTRAHVLVQHSSAAPRGSHHRWL